MRQCSDPRGVKAHQADPRQESGGGIWAWQNRQQPQEADREEAVWEKGEGAPSPALAGRGQRGTPSGTPVPGQATRGCLKWEPCFLERGAGTVWGQWLRAVSTPTCPCPVGKPSEKVIRLSCAPKSQRPDSPHRRGLPTPLPPHLSSWLQGDSLHHPRPCVPRAGAPLFPAHLARLLVHIPASPLQPGLAGAPLVLPVSLRLACGGAQVPFVGCMGMLSNIAVTLMLGNRYSRGSSLGQPWLTAQATPSHGAPSKHSASALPSVQAPAVPRTPGQDRRKAPTGDQRRGQENGIPGPWGLRLDPWHPTRPGVQEFRSGRP